jgi:prolyl-tRNA editing enzyme YbaK/EbsC (Cys-tRNA(Pro) deacylase)
VRRLSFASAEQTQQLTGMEIGGVTPFALPDDLPLWIDDAVVSRDRVIVGGGSRRVKLLVPASALRAIASEVLTIRQDRSDD